MRYHYAFEAVRLLKQCIEQLEEVIECDEQLSTSDHVSTSSLYDMKEALFLVESALFCFFSILLEEEIGNPPSRHSNLQDCCVDLTKSVATLQAILKERDSAANSHQHSSDPHRYYTSRSVTDSLLFRLNVVLQLCLVRIEDARLVLCGSRRLGRQNEVGPRNTIIAQGLPILWKGLVGGFGLAASAILWGTRHSSKPFWSNWIQQKLQTNRTWILPIAQMTTSLVLVKWFHRKWGQLWMSTKLTRSTEALEAWCRQWELFMDHKTRQRSRSRSIDVDDMGQERDVEDIAAVDSARNQRLIEYALNETPKTTFWQSQGELRFWMIKRAMDVFYASVGTAIDLTGHDNKSNQGKNSNTNWQVPLVTAAVSSFYSVTGARDRAVEVTSSSRSAQKLIKEAWGMVSLPSVKNLSLQASRLLKGAAVADRVEICGVSCFCLSRDPAPELAAAIKRNRRIHQRRKPIATLSTIDEQEEMSPSTPNSGCRRPFTRSPSTRYRQRDVIFHLTGGGFFAHIIASDLPYLLDWSAKTGAVVICPEYSLLPEHTFPYALNQAEQVYNALVTDEAVSTLGFETNRIVVTGESAGGNLAASLCVKIANSHQPPTENDSVLVALPEDKGGWIRMPDALMLSCPVLNLSLELSLSRVAGTNDPVLPSGLLTAISDAYLPPELGVSKREPLASPLFASDKTLSQFPATLLFASSQDPLLDDSVVFNQRLRSLGVESDLFAAINMPHAYLGLGTAGFPEALQVQHLCVSWLNQQFAKGSREENPDHTPAK